MADNNAPILASASVSAAAATVSAIIPARNEEAVIAACVESLVAQVEINEVIVVNDQSTDKTAQIVRDIVARNRKVKLLETDGPPQGWVGKNYAVSVGAQEAKGDWLLFTDADAEHLSGSTAQALAKAQETGAALVSFSAEQITQRWYERALIPFVYCRLAKVYSYDAVNDAKNPAAAANGQYLMIRRDAYDAIGGHAASRAKYWKMLRWRVCKARRFAHLVWFAGTGLCGRECIGRLRRCGKAGKRICIGLLAGRRVRYRRVGCVGSMDDCYC